MIDLKKQRGFTLIELMIAMTVFSVIMLLSTYVFIQINKYYTKGITTIRLQDTARNIISDISTQIQFTNVDLRPKDGTTSNPNDEICIGYKKYVYKINSSNTTENPALYSVPVDEDCVNLPSATEKNLLPIGARILAFNIKRSGQLYDLDISLIFGEEDLFLKPYPDPKTWKCASDKGSEYCTSAKLSTTVYKRISQ